MRKSSRSGRPDGNRGGALRGAPTRVNKLGNELEKACRTVVTGVTFSTAPGLVVSCLLEVEEAAKLLRAGRVAQLAQGLGLYLPDALAGDVELLADFFQRMVGVHVDAEAHAQHLGLARR